MFVSHNEQIHMNKQSCGLESHYVDSIRTQVTNLMTLTRLDKIREEFDFTSTWTPLTRDLT